METIEIHFGENFGQSLIRLAGILNREAIKQLAAPVIEPVNIHEARLCFKRLRSLLRMARHGLDQGEFKQLNTFYRDQARALAGQRDLAVTIDALKPYIKSRDSVQEKAFLSRLKAALVDKKGKTLKNKTLENTPGEVLHQLTKMQPQLAHWKVVDENPELFLFGVQTTYGLAKKELTSLKLAVNDHLLHEWRKNVKYLWYQLEMLISLWPNMLKTWTKEIKTLAQALGRHHDLLLVENAIREFIDPELEDFAMTTLHELSTEKKNLEKDALILGAKIFSLRQACFYRMLAQCLPVKKKDDLPE